MLLLKMRVQRNDFFFRVVRLQIQLSNQTVNYKLDTAICDFFYNFGTYKIDLK